MYRYFSKITLIRAIFPLKVLKSIIFKKNGFRPGRQIPPPRHIFVNILRNYAKYIFWRRIMIKIMVEM